MKWLAHKDGSLYSCNNSGSSAWGSRPRRGCTLERLEQRLTFNAPETAWIDNGVLYIRGSEVKNDVINISKSQNNYVISINGAVSVFSMDLFVEVRAYGGDPFDPFVGEEKGGGNDTIRAIISTVNKPLY